MQIFLVSVLSLFLELLLIRWIGTEINIFAYLQNTVLVVCFLGLGFGCFSSDKPVRIGRSLLCLLILVTILCVPFTRNIAANISLLLGAFEDLVVWQMVDYQSFTHRILAVLCGLVLSLAIMLLLWSIFLPLGRILGREMNADAHVLRAYSINVLGSLAGIWLFVILSVYSQPPFVWFAVAAILYFAFIDWSSRDKFLHLGLAIASVALTLTSYLTDSSIELKWSPYQKLSIDKTPPEHMYFREYAVSVNNIGFQCLMDFRDEKFQSQPDYVDASLRGLSHYDIPFLVHPAPKKVLIVGAGTGTDVAAAIRNGVERVVAVEIDPVVIGYGKKYHPEQPYSSEKVQVINNDARSFFATSTQKFDLIDFGLLDSHTTPVMSNIRLDHFVYTKDSLAQALNLLAPGGVISLAFNVQRPFIADRIAEAFKELTGKVPLIYEVPVSHYGPGGFVFLVGDQDSIRSMISANSRLDGLLTKLSAEHPINLPLTTRVITDDWPYLYLQSAKIPTLYYLLGLMLITLGLLTLRYLRREGVEIEWSSGHTHFLLLGIAFMLLEVQGISRASAVLGATWLVNAVIISGVLLMILLANALVIRFPKFPVTIAYLGLLCLCAALYFLDYSIFHTLSGLEKSIAVGLVTTCPIILSGIIFARSFAAAEQKNAALGANLMGALFGGVLQSVTFVIGIKAVLLLVILFYGAAFATRPSRA